MPAKKATSRLIDEISSLKRAAHIENGGAFLDRYKGGECSIFTNSKESSDILHNLLVQAFSSGHTESYWREHPEEALHEKVKIHENDEWCLYEIKFPVSENTAQIRAEQIQNLTKTLIAPDHKRSR